MTYRIDAPNRQYTGQVAGIAFRNGTADGLTDVPDYFRRHTGYTITDTTPEPDENPEPETEPAEKPAARKPRKTTTTDHD
ncbi:hypothetical protein [Bifidobacterium samirii]|uniref:Uncharacterized protein n=1 Tax=Bifidobacterium samirii TaxID=2306974 RepID=A0A430FUF6_9BIFI|nr:hypothetical protein [Bifidobacterium samirii]RSX56768.1 hypothetical protein D2E24_1058 [Bifidobacterium samirii]